MSTELVPTRKQPFAPVVNEILKAQDSPSLTGLLKELQIEVLKRTDLREIALMSLVSRYFNWLVADDTLWSWNASQIDHVLDTSLSRPPFYKQVVSSIQDTQEAVRNFPNLPKEITTIIKGPAISEIDRLQLWADFDKTRKKAENVRIRPNDIDQILLLPNPSIEERNRVKKWLKARDCLIIREGNPILMPGGRTLASLTSSQEVIDEAVAFEAWVEANPQVVAQVDSFDLDRKEMSSLPPLIGRFVNLSMLELQGNQLTSLPYELCNLRRLFVLDVSVNNLTSLPIEIGNLIGMHSLALNDNQLSSLPDEIRNLTALIHFEVGNNQLKTVPSILARFRNLRKLDLRNNLLTSIPDEILRRGFRELLVSGNPFPLRQRVTSSLNEKPLMKFGLFAATVVSAYLAYRYLNS